MRVASFVPTATEWLYEMGLEDRLVSVTSECDVPVRAKKEKPIAVRATLEGSLEDARAVDLLVREAGELYRLDPQVLLLAKPDVILTQSLCDVCAASHAQVAAAKRILGYAPKILEVSPARLDAVPEDARAIARMAGAPGAGDAIATRIVERIHRVRRAVAGRPRPRVAFLEWSDPPMSAGHWIPDMLDAAGLHDPLARHGAKSARLSWDDLHAARPHALLVAPCGFDLARSRREAEKVAREFPHLPVFAFDASRYFARSGPSVAAGVELLAHVLHPGLVADPDPGAWARIQ